MSADPYVDFGPCGNAVHIYATKKYGNLHQSAKGLYTKGTKYRLRVWTRSDAGAPSRPMAVIADFGRVVDGGSVAEGPGVDLPATPGWTLVQDVFTLTADATELAIQINSTRSDDVSDDVWIAGFSVVPE